MAGVVEDFDGERTAEGMDSLFVDTVFCADVGVDVAKVRHYRVVAEVFGRKRASGHGIRVTRLGRANMAISMLSEKNCAVESIIRNLVQVIVCSLPSASSIEYLSVSVFMVLRVF